ncbi:glycosyltransferase family 39 protein [Candidatus Roizmanbacteria bacterium]|nr:MAG: glycosyltransferase family 39 protein [Candidatus Roizmanbacteria bacterium]
MNYLKHLLNKKAYLLLALFTFVTVMLHMRQIEFPCFNSDEASFAYNAYSIAKTARDEYGTLLPTRFKAFGENKLPVTIYTIAAFVGPLGLSETTARLPFILIGIISPILFFVLTKKLTGKESIGLITAFLASISPWIQIMSRHIHENIIMLVLVIGMLWILYELQKKVTMRRLLFLSLLVGIGLFTYHIGKVIAVFVLMWVAYLILLKKQNRSHMKEAAVIFAIPFVIFGATELMNPTSRISNLLFTSNKGFTLSIEELRKEHDSRIVHNKISKSVSVLSNQYLSYFSPEFLVRKGDNNARFGFEGISPITPVTYIFILIGLYFMFKNREESRFLLVSLMLTAPLSAALSWQEYSLTRSFLLIIPFLIFASYGIYHGTLTFKKTSFRILFLTVVLGSILYFNFFSWDFYFNHYPKRVEAIYGWQCGYKNMGQYIKENYNNFERFYITKKLGQPYIFTLFYLQYLPSDYHKQAELTELDEYGFGQVEKYDKFIFDMPEPDRNESAVFIGYPEEFTNLSRDAVKVISVEGNDIFWLYEGQRNK